MRVTHMYLILPVLVVSLSCAVNSAPLTLIHDTGNTLPLAPYIKINGKVAKSPKDATTPLFPDAPILYPISTPSMTPGTVEPRTITIPYLPRPLFIIGNDHFSQAWLASRGEALKKLNAVGYLVKAESPDEAQAIRALNPELGIVVASGDSIAKQLGLKHYPVLISQKGIEQ